MTKYTYLRTYLRVKLHSPKIGCLERNLSTPAPCTPSVSVCVLGEGEGLFYLFPVSRAEFSIRIISATEWVNTFTWKFFEGWNPIWFIGWCLQIISETEKLAKSARESQKRNSAVKSILIKDYPIKTKVIFILKFIACLALLGLWDSGVLQLKLEFLIPL